MQVEVEAVVVQKTHVLMHLETLQIFNLQPRHGLELVKIYRSALIVKVLSEGELSLIPTPDFKATALGLGKNENFR